MKSLRNEMLEIVNLDNYCKPGTSTLISGWCETQEKLVSKFIEKTKYIKTPDITHMTPVFKNNTTGSGKLDYTQNFYAGTKCLGFWNPTFYEVPLDLPLRNIIAIWRFLKTKHFNSQGY